MDCSLKAAAIDVVKHHNSISDRKMAVSCIFLVRFGRHAYARSSNTSSRSFAHRASLLRHWHFHGLSIISFHLILVVYPLLRASFYN
jgi:hypothetical protein